MMAGALSALQEQGVRVCAALGITKIGHSPKANQAGQLPSVDWIEGEHPMPGEASLKAGERLLSWIEQRTENVLVLLSGGASSVVESLDDGLDFETYRRLIATLLSSGSSIHELNAYRRSVSVLKGGKLGALLQDRLDSVWVVSDVLDDDLQTIASGMFYRRETADRHYIVSSARIELPRVVAILEGLGYGVTSLPLSNHLDSLVSTLTLHASQLQSAKAIVGMGECPVVVRGEGLGGRCSYLAHLMARVLDGRKGTHFVALATDGTDGPTAYAGGYVDSMSLSIDPKGWQDASERFDSATWLLQNGLSLKTGPTGTNVNDLYLLWRD